MARARASASAFECENGVSGAMGVRRAMHDVLEIPYRVIDVATGDLGTPFHFDSEDEFGALSRSFATRGRSITLGFSSNVASASRAG